VFRLSDHTGDFAIEAESPTPEAALGELVRALVVLMLGEDETLRSDASMTLALDGFDAEDLVVNFGNELLFLFETERFLPASLIVDRLELEAPAARLEARLFGERLDRHRPLARPAKAVTHHEATFDVSPERTRARLVIDL
jgi:SHS2 domain-containing protein